MQEFFLFIQHHLALSAGFLVVLAFAVMIEFYRLRQGIRRIGAAETVRLINRENAVVMDVRPEEAFRAGHIGNAVSFPADTLKNMDKSARTMAKYSKRPVVIVSGTDAEGVRIATTLKQLGINAQVLAGGVRAFREAELPLVK